MSNKRLEPTEELVRRISADKKEPEWMLAKRLEGLRLFSDAKMPVWSPDISGLDLENITYYVPPELAEKESWEDLPEEVKKTFDELGIPKAERDYLGGVGAQYDSGVVYHRIQESLRAKGVVFVNMDEAVHSHPELVQKYFMTDCVPVKDHRFTMLHTAFWSGGTFIYVPKGVKVELPLQAYFFMKARQSAQFEHTLIIADDGAEVTYIEGCSAPQYTESSLHAGCVELFVGKNASIKYISIENWSRNTYNLNTKRAIVSEGGLVKWVNGNMGSGVTMLYPSSVLVGEGARAENIGIVIAGEGQTQDTGGKVMHLAPNTSSVIHSKSISKNGGIANYRGLIRVGKKGTGTKSSLVCDSLLLDEISQANAFPAIKNSNKDVEISHEARLGAIGEDEIFYLATRGLSEAQAIRLVVNGFAEPILKELPLEYAIELQKVIDLEMRT